MGWTIEDLPPLQAWSFYYHVAKYGAARWEFDYGKPPTPALPPQPPEPKPDEPEIDKPKAKGSFAPILFGIIAAATALRRG